MILGAQEASKRLRHSRVEPAHILLGLLDIGEGRGHQILLRSSVDVQELRRHLASSLLPSNVDLSLEDIKFTPLALRVLELAVEEEAQCSLQGMVGTEHLLIGLLRVEGTSDILRGTGLTLEMCRQMIPEISERSARGVFEISYEGTQSRIELLQTGEIETHGLQPGGSMGVIMARFNDLDGYEEYVATVKDRWLNSDADEYGPKEFRISLLNWIESHVLPELRKLKQRPGDRDA